MTVVQPCIWSKKEPSQFSMGQTAQSLTCSIMEKPHTRLDECPRILLECFRARNSACTTLHRRDASDSTSNRLHSSITMGWLNRIRNGNAADLFYCEEKDPAKAKGSVTTNEKNREVILRVW